MIEWTAWHEKHSDKIELIAGVDCWIWTACMDRNGYARVSYNREGTFGHRASFEEANGRRATGLVRHICGNRLCVRPGHLKEGTHADNAKDMATMFTGRGHLLEADVRSIRRMYRDGTPLKNIAKAFSIAYGTVYPIVIGKSYRHVDSEIQRDFALRSAKKLTDEDIDAIRRDLLRGDMRQSKIAAKYGVRQSLISRINTGARHKKYT